jgi:SAM-dependent methyltransferase
MENIFVTDTVNEVAFLIKELALPPGSTILDVGCGTGRHSIELAKHGFKVTGLDLSAEMLNQAQQAAQEAGVEVNWVHSNAAEFSFPEPFDAVIGLCEGAFGLLSATDDPIDQPLAILKNIAGCMKPQAKVILTVLNAMKMIRQYSDEDVASGRFDPLTLSDSYPFAPREGMEEIKVRERSFMPTEMEMLCRMAGLTVLNIWGGTAGNWGKRTIDLDEFELMIVAEKD